MRQSKEVAKRKARVSKCQARVMNEMVSAFVLMFESAHVNFVSTQIIPLSSSAAAIAANTVLPDAWLTARAA